MNKITFLGQTERYMPAFGISRKIAFENKLKADLFRNNSPLYIIEYSTTNILKTNRGMFHDISYC